jgi:hypothetical protein
MCEHFGEIPDKLGEIILIENRPYNLFEELF